jgi:hypothetical protein
MTMRAAAAILLLAACRGPAPTESTVTLRTPAGAVFAVSTEGGLLAMSDVVGDSDQVPFRYYIGNGMFDDVANVVSRGKVFTILKPYSSRLNEARFARSPARPGEELFIESEGYQDVAILLPVDLYEEGRRGNLLVLHEEGLLEIYGKRMAQQGDATPDLPAGVADLDAFARRHAGSGVFVWRDEFMQMVGILNGVYCTSPPALAFVGIDEIAQVMPEPFQYFERQTLPKRADFEYGIPRDFEGERANASGSGPVPVHPDALD